MCDVTHDNVSVSVNLCRSLSGELQRNPFDLLNALYHFVDLEVVIRAKNSSARSLQLRTGNVEFC